MNLNGGWLRIELTRLGVTPYKAAQLIGLERADKLYRHIHNQTHLNAETLADLCRVLPKLDIRYVLTGERTL